MKYYNSNSNKGFSLIEMLFYIAIVSILGMVVISSLITMTRSFRVTSVNADLTKGVLVMEKISREIRQAYEISSISNSDLRLNTKDESGNNMTVRFLLSGDDIQFYSNDVLIGNINPENFSVDSMLFTQITTTIGKGVKIQISAHSTRDPNNRVETFYDTVALRGIY